MTVHIMLDLETWGKIPGSDLRSIGATVFDPLTGWVGECRTCKGGTTRGNVNDGGDCSDCLNTREEHGATFYVATDNPIVCTMRFSNCKSDECRKYNLTRDPETVQWWSEQSAEAQAAFNNPIDLRDALIQFADWLCAMRPLIDGQPQVYMLGNHRYPNDTGIWAHGPSFDVSIIEAAFRAVGLPIPWHYRAPRDTRTVLEDAGIDPHKGLEQFSTGTHHHALHDAIGQAKAVCHAKALIRGWRHAWDSAHHLFPEHGIVDPIMPELR